MKKLNTEEISKFDADDMLQRILDMPQQLQHAYELSSATEIKIDRPKVRNICIAGMGGSAIGGDVAVANAGTEQTLPIVVNRHYRLPGFVDEHSLVLVSSYSGETEETLSALQDAVERNAQIICVSSGEKLSEQARDLGATLFSIPGGAPPRAALAYLTVPILVCLRFMGMIAELGSGIKESVTLLNQLGKEVHPDVEESTAKTMSRSLHNTIPLIYSGSDGMQAVAVRWKGQLSENSKVLAFCNFFPELNHNEIMGWREQTRQNNFQVVYLSDRDDHSRIQKRMAITKELLREKGKTILELESRGDSRLARLFSLIFLGDMVSLYLAILNEVDPTNIDNINFLKQELSKRQE